MNKDIKKKGFIGIFLILLLSPFVIKAEESDKNSNSRLPVKEINNFTQVFEQIRTGYVAVSYTHLTLPTTPYV